MEKYLKEEKSKMLELIAWRFARMMRYKDVEDLRNHSVGIITDLNSGDSEVCFQGEEHKRLFGEFRPFHGPKDVEEHFNGKNIILPQFEEGFFRLLDCHWLIQQFEEGQRWLDYDYLAHDKTGRIVWLLLVIELSLDPLSHHIISSLYIGMSDVYHRERDAMLELARKDALTGLFNRHMMNSMVDDYLKDRGSEEACIAIVDANDFKAVNDKYGHQCGDRALIALSEELQKNFYNRAKDIIFRYGGDEFIICLKDTAEKDAKERFAAFSEKPICFDTEDGKKCFTVSLGYAVKKPNEDKGVFELIREADKALYYVKAHREIGYASYNQIKK